MGKKEKPTVPNSKFTLRVSLGSAGEGSQTPLTVRVYVGERLHKRYECSAPPRAELMNWAAADSNLLSDLMAAEAAAPTSQKSQNLQRDLRAVGQQRFDEFFGQPRHGKDARHKIRELFLSKNLRQVTVESDIRGLTLDVFHLGASDGFQNNDGFIGLRAPVAYAPAADYEDDEPEYHPSIGFLACHRLSSVDSGAALSELRRLEASGLIREVEVCTPLRDISDKVLVEADHHALYALVGSKRRGIWQITSHLERPGGVAFFELDCGARIGAHHFADKYCPNFIGQPLIFLNLCNSGAARAAADRTLPDLLSQKGAFGVIAPVMLVDEHFAAVFSSHFYVELIENGSRNRVPLVGGRTVGQALVEARRACQKSGHLSGLGYALYAQSDFDLLAFPEEELVA